MALMSHVHEIGFGHPAGKVWSQGPELSQRRYQEPRSRAGPEGPSLMAMVYVAIDSAGARSYLTQQILCLVAHTELLGPASRDGQPRSTRK